MQTMYKYSKSFKNQYTVLTYATTINLLIVITWIVLTPLLVPLNGLEKAGTDIHGSSVIIFQYVQPVNGFLTDITV